jgi:hypothetical protein
MLLGSGLCVARTPRLPRIQTLNRSKLANPASICKSKTVLPNLSREIGREIDIGLNKSCHFFMLSAAFVDDQHDSNCHRPCATV